MRANAPTQSEIEAIVRVVLQRVRLLQSAPTSSASAATAPLPERPGSTLCLDQKVVTLQDLSEHWKSLSVLEVPAKSIVTPAVQDELRQRGIALQRVGSASSSAAALQNPQAAARRMLVVTAASSHSVLNSQLVSQKVTVHNASQDDQLTLATLQQHLATVEHIAIWNASRPYAAMAACSSAPNVRGLQLSQLDDLSEALEQAQPNALILDARRWSANSVASLARAWTRRLS